MSRLSDDHAGLIAVIIVVAILLLVANDSRRSHDHCRETFTADECSDMMNDLRPPGGPGGGF